jgi:hypothetical protein
VSEGQEAGGVDDLHARGRRVDEGPKATMGAKIQACRRPRTATPP